jgi:hypothetical protein
MTSTITGDRHEDLCSHGAASAAGPAVRPCLAGAQPLALFPMMPVMGNLTLVVAAMSYAGQLSLTATASSDSCRPRRCSPTARSALNSLTPADRLPSSPSRRHGQRS